MRVSVVTALFASCLLPTTVLSEASSIRGASLLSDNAEDSGGGDDTSYMTSPLRNMIVDEDGFYIFEEEMREQVEDEPQRTLRKKNKRNKRCATTENVDYFDITIAIRPRRAPTNCKLADQVLLGHDINRVMWDYGVGEAGKHDDVIFQAVVCPNPTTSAQHQQILALSTNGIELRPSPDFMYSGIGGCRFCSDDDVDKRFLIADFMTTSRELGSAWFENTFKPQLETTLKNAIENEVVPLHDGCLGSNPTIEVTVVGMSLSELELSCKGPNGDIQFLKTFNMQDIVLDQAKHSCGKCNQIDFTTGQSRGRDNGVKRGPVAPGDYIKNQYYKKKNGVRITAFSDTGYTPNGQARIFDTSDPHSDPDLGSPNEHCPGGGPGKGTGGIPGAEGANCHPVGNVLIIQESKKGYPDDNEHGGTIRFKFKTPVLFSDIGLMDIDEIDQRLEFEYSDGSKRVYAYRGLGQNSVQRVIANQYDVVRVDVIFPSSGAISEINFCPECGR